MIHLGILVLSSILLLLFRGLVTRVHARLFGLSEEEVARAYFHHLAHYKITIFLLVVVPYLALRMMR